jgi:hypothetical protein
MVHRDDLKDYTHAELCLPEKEPDMYWKGHLSSLRQLGFFEVIIDQDIEDGK